MSFIGPERTVFPGCVLKGPEILSFCRVEKRVALLVSRLDLDLFQPIVSLKSRIISTLEDVIGKFRFETVIDGENTD